MLAWHTAVRSGEKTLLVVNGVRVELHRTGAFGQTPKQIYIAPMRYHFYSLFVRLYRTAGGNNNVGAFPLRLLSATSDDILLRRSNINIGLVELRHLQPSPTALNPDDL